MSSCRIDTDGAGCEHDFIQRTIARIEKDMGILQADKTLPANRLIFDVRRNEALLHRFRADLAGIMNEYGLSEAEQAALRTVDLKALSELGLHPYFLPQVARLFKGAGYNHNDSEAAQLYARKMLAAGD
ncbi:MAG: hypothetical protein ACKVQU_12525 [Burkholderiales bacterium]